jgi:hypothetical protein
MSEELNQFNHTVLIMDLVFWKGFLEQFHGLGLVQFRHIKDAFFGDLEPCYHFLVSCCENNRSLLV